MRGLRPEEVETLAELARPGEDSPYQPHEEFMVPVATRLIDRGLVTRIYRPDHPETEWTDRITPLGRLALRIHLALSLEVR